MQSDKSEFVRLLIKLGLAKTETGATRIAIGIIIAILVVTLFLFMSGGSGDKPLPDDQNPLLDPSLQQA